MNALSAHSSLTHLNTTPLPHTHTHTHTHPHPHAHTNTQGSFQLYDCDHDGYITREDMCSVVDAIYQMVGNMVQFCDDNTPQKRVDQLFESMDTVQ